MVRDRERLKLLFLSCFSSDLAAHRAAAHTSSSPLTTVLLSLQVSTEAPVGPSCTVGQVQPSHTWIHLPAPQLGPLVNHIVIANN